MDQREKIVVAVALSMVLWTLLWVVVGTYGSAEAFWPFGCWLAGPIGIIVYKMLGGRL